MNEVISKDQLLRVLKEKWRMMILVTLTIVLIGGYIDFFVLEPKYEVKSSIFIGKDIGQGAGGEESLYNYSDVTMYRNLMDTYVKLIQGKDMIKETIEKNNLDISLEKVLNNLQVTNELGTQIIDVSLTYNDKKVATETLTTIVNEFSSYAKELVPNVSVKVIESPVEPNSPVSPNKSKDMILLVVVGALISMLIALITFIIDNKIRNKDDLEILLGVPVVGCISEMR